MLSEPGGESSGGGAGGSVHGGAGALGAWGHEWEDGHKGPHRVDGRTAAAFTPVPMLMRPGEVWFRDNMTYHRGSPVSAAAPFASSSSLKDAAAQNTSTRPRDVFHYYFHTATEQAVAAMDRGRTLGWVRRPYLTLFA